MVSQHHENQASASAADDMPLISVIMPVFNAGRYLRPAVESIINQTWRNWELIIVDDGSTDDCLKTIADIDDARIRRQRQDNAGKPVVMNRALGMSSGDFWAILDADDISYPRRLELQVKCLLENPDLAAVFCGNSLIIEGKVLAPITWSKTREQCHQDIAMGSMPAHDPTGMYRAELTRDFTYAEDLPVVEGLDFVLRLGERHPMMMIGECLYGYRVHPSSITRRDPGRRNGLVAEVFRRMCSRRGLSPRALDALTFGIGKGSDDQDNGIAAQFTMSVASQVLAGERIGAIRTGLACWRLRPFRALYARSLLYSLFPKPLLMAYRKAKARKALEHWSRVSGGPQSVNA